MKRTFYIVMAAALVLSAILWWYYRRQSDFKAAYIAGKEYTADDARAAIAVVKATYGATMAANIERLARWETGHFTSLQYRKTGTGGMIAGGGAPYYGFYAPFFLAHPSYTPVGTTEMLANTDVWGDGGKKVFVIMPSVEAWMMFLADYATRYKNEGGIYRWAGTDPVKQQQYAAYLSKVSTPFTNAT